MDSLIKEKNTSISNKNNYYNEVNLNNSNKKAIDNSKQNIKFSAISKKNKTKKNEAKIKKTKKVIVITVVIIIILGLILYLYRDKIFNNCGLNIESADDDFSKKGVEWFNSKVKEVMKNQTK